MKPCVVAQLNQMLLKRVIISDDRLCWVTGEHENVTIIWSEIVTDSDTTNGDGEVEKCFLVTFPWHEHSHVDVRIRVGVAFFYDISQGLSRMKETDMER